MIAEEGWKITRLRPLSRTILGGAGCQQAFESGVDEPPPPAAPGGLLAGLGAGPRPWPARTRARDATEGATPGPWRPSCRTTLTGPWPRAREPLRGRAYCHRLVRGRLTQTSRTGPGAAGPGPPAQPPAPRRGHGPSGHRTSCARSPARRRTWSPPHAERHRATRRWQGEHGGQQAHSYSPAKHNRSVTTTTARSVTDVLTQNCHRSPETSQLSRMGERYVHVGKVRSRFREAPIKVPHGRDARRGHVHAPRARPGSSPAARAAAGEPTRSHLRRRGRTPEARPRGPGRIARADDERGTATRTRQNQPTGADHL